MSHDHSSSPEALFPKAPPSSTSQVNPVTVSLPTALVQRHEVSQFTRHPLDGFLFPKMLPLGPCPQRGKGGLPLGQLGLYYYLVTLHSTIHNNDDDYDNKNDESFSRSHLKNYFQGLSRGSSG